MRVVGCVEAVRGGLGFVHRGSGGRVLAKTGCYCDVGLPLFREPLETSVHDEKLVF